MAASKGSLTGKKLNDYTLLDKLGEGAFGTVYKAKKGDGSLFAIKCPLNNASATVNRQEFETAKLISQHDNIVTIADFLTSKDKLRIYLVMEFCEGGDLNNYVIEKKPRFEEKLNFMVDMARGVNYLHSMKIIHRDLKPHNILLSKGKDRFLCKITDFGMSKVQKQANNYFSTMCGTMIYQAPEVLDGMKYNFSADVFSLGLIYFAIASGATVTGDDEAKHLLPLVRAEGDVLPVSTAVRRQKLSKDRMVRDHFDSHPALGQVIYEMVEYDPKKRPPMDLVIAKIAEAKGRTLSKPAVDEAAVMFGHAMFFKLMNDLQRAMSKVEDEDLGSFQDDANNGRIEVVDVRSNLPEPK